MRASDEWKTELDRTKRNNKEGVSAEGRKTTAGCLVVGGELLFRRGMIFLLLYILGLYLTWSSGSLQEQQLWAQHKLGQGAFQKGSDTVTLAAKEWVSLWVCPWKVRDVECNLWLKREWAQAVLLLLLLGGVFTVWGFWNLLSVSCTFFFGHVWCLWWCHCRMECDVEVLHFQPNYKVGDHLV